MGLSPYFLDTYTPTPSGSYGSIMPNYIYLESVLLDIDVPISSLLFKLYAIPNGTPVIYPPFSTGTLRAFIYSVDSDGKPNQILFSSLNTFDVSTINSQYTDAIFDFADVLPNQKIAVGYAYETSGGQPGWIGWLASQIGPQGGYGYFPYGVFWIKYPTGIWIKAYGEYTDLGATINFTNKSVKADMIDRSSFVPTITFF